MPKSEHTVKPEVKLTSHNQRFTQFLKHQTKFSMFHNTTFNVSTAKEEAHIWGLGYGLYAVHLFNNFVDICKCLSASCIGLHLQQCSDSFSF